MGQGPLAAPGRPDGPTLTGTLIHARTDEVLAAVALTLTREASDAVGGLHWARSRSPQDSHEVLREALREVVEGARRQAGSCVYLLGTGRTLPSGWMIREALEGVPSYGRDHVVRAVSREERGVEVRFVGVEKRAAAWGGDSGPCRPVTPVTSPDGPQRPRISAGPTAAAPEWGWVEGRA